jgi:hypothetical protein
VDHRDQVVLKAIKEIKVLLDLKAPRVLRALVEHNRLFLVLKDRVDLVE